MQASRNLKDHQEELQQANGALHEARAEIEDLERKLADNRAHARRMEEGLKNLEEEREKAERDFDEKVGRLKGLRDGDQSQYEAKLSEVSIELEREKQKAVSDKEKEMKTILAEEKEEGERCKKELDRIRVSLAHAQDGEERAHGQCRELQARNAEIDADLKALKASLLDAHVRLEANEREADGICTELERQKAELKEEIDVMTALVNAAAVREEEGISAMRACKGRVSELERALGGVEKKYADLSMDCEMLVKDLNEGTDNVQTAKGALEVRHSVSDCLNMHYCMRQERTCADLSLDCEVLVKYDHKPSNSVRWCKGKLSYDQLLLKLMKDFEGAHGKQEASVLSLSSLDHRFYCF